MLNETESRVVTDSTVATDSIIKSDIELDGEKLKFAGTALKNFHDIVKNVKIDKRLIKRTTRSTQRDIKSLNKLKEDEKCYSTKRRIMSKTPSAGTRSKNVSLIKHSKDLTDR